MNWITLLIPDIRETLGYKHVRKDKLDAHIDSIVLSALLLDNSTSLQCFVWMCKVVKQAHPIVHILTPTATFNEVYKNHMFIFLSQ